MWTVDEAATRRVITVTPDRTVGECEILMLDNGLRHLPVVDASGAPIGLMTDRRVLGLTRRDLHKVTVREAIDPIQVVVPVDVGFQALLDKLLASSQGAAVLVDADGKLAGVFSEHDAMRFAETALPVTLSVADVGGTRAELVSVPLGSPAYEARNLMLENGIHHVLVTHDDGRLAGVISLRDLPGLDVTLIDGRMNAVVHQVAPQDDLHKAISLMVRHKVGSVAVVDAGDVAVGVITRTDVLEALCEHLTHR